MIKLAPRLLLLLPSLVSPNYYKIGHIRKCGTRERGGGGGSGGVVYIVQPFSVHQIFQYVPIFIS